MDATIGDTKLGRRRFFQFQEPRKAASAASGPFRQRFEASPPLLADAILPRAIWVGIAPPKDELLC